MSYWLSITVISVNLIPTFIFITLAFNYTSMTWPNSLARAQPLTEKKKT